MRITLLLIFLTTFLPLYAIQLGVDVFFSEGHDHELNNKRVGLLTNHTGVNSDLVPTLELCSLLNLRAIFAPEHGLNGSAYAFENVKHGKSGKVPIYSLHGKTKRPTQEMLDTVDVILVDIQDVGVRCYTYITTLCYMMEECAKRKIPVIVFDRPNPIGGDIVDGTMLEPKYRAFASYINVPYCHGMTIGELARFFNTEYKVHCKLSVVPMKGWKRSMSFDETGLTWIPTSPHIPEASTTLYYPVTGLIGELGIVNIGVGYTLPFKIVGAPWIDAQTFSSKLNDLHLPGVTFVPTYYRPFYGAMKGQECQGVLIRVTHRAHFKPATTQMAILGMLKSLYPKQMTPALAKLASKERRLFCNAAGTEAIANILTSEQYATFKLMGIHKIERERFLKKRQKYLIY